MKKETLEEAVQRITDDWFNSFNSLETELVEEGIKWQQERSYSEEDIRNAIDYGAELGLSDNIGNSFEWKIKKDLWFEQFKKK